MELRTKDHPEANGRKPQIGDVAFNVDLPLENGDTLHLHLGKKGRDTLFGMLIADCHDSGEPEPVEMTVVREQLEGYDCHAGFAQPATQAAMQEYLDRSRKCPKCGRGMYHTRLRGYQCHTCS